MRLKHFPVLMIIMFHFSGVHAQNIHYTDTVYVNDNIKIPCKIINKSNRQLTFIYGDSATSIVDIDNIISYKIADIKALRQYEQSKFEGYSNNSIFFEGLGNGILGSINFDKIFYREKDFATSFRIGFSQMSDGGLLPLEVNFLWNVKPEALHSELGFGFTPNIWGNYKIKYGIFRIGFRYQQPKGGLFFRAGLMAMYQFPFKDSDSWSGARTQEGFFLPWIGLSIGYTLPGYK
jgi:hypothetical protein